MNYYDLLEISMNASEEVVKAAYKAQVNKYHPDNNRTGNSEKMAEINRAYDILSNPVLRAEYDKKLLEENINNDKTERNHETNSGKKDDDISNNHYSKNNMSNVQPKESDIDGKGNVLPVYLSLPVILILFYFFWPVAIVLFIMRISKLKNDNSIVDRDKKIKNTKRVGFGLLAFCGIIVVFAFFIGISVEDTDTNNMVVENVPTNSYENHTEQQEIIETNVEMESEVDTAEKVMVVTNDIVNSEEEQIEESDIYLEQTTEDKGVMEYAKEYIDDAFSEKEVSIEEQANGLYTEYYPTFILFDYEENLIFYKNVKLNIYIDDEKIGKVEQGDAPCYGLILEKGSHDLKISSSIINSESEIFKVGDSRYFGGVPNIFVVKIAFKNGDAVVDKITGMNTMVYNSIDEAAIDYLNVTNQAAAIYQPVGKFDEVVDLYEEINPTSQEDMLNNLE